jgi:hypothetical protein
MKRFFKTSAKIGCLTIGGIMALIAVVGMTQAVLDKRTPEQRAADHARFAAKMAAAQKRRDVKRAASEKAEAARVARMGKVELLRPLHWWKGGFDAVMLADLKIRNTTPHDVKDMVIACVEYAPSGTMIDHNTHTQYDIVKAATTETFHRVNLGFVHPQAQQASCHIVSYQTLP